MATTEDARELTLEQRDRQVALGLRATADAVASWSLLDLADLDASMVLWLPVYVAQVRERAAESARIAAAYLTEYRTVEHVEDQVIVEPTFNETQAIVTARVAGPLTVKTLIGRGVDPGLAFSAGQRAAAARANKWAMAGGRQLIVRSAQQTPRRTWRRVSDGSPCAFCAMLVARSISYPGSLPPNFRSHPKCGCTAEEVAPDDPPTDEEVEWIAAYDQAAAQARAAGEPVVAPSGRRRRDTVLWRMRRNRPDLFSDGVHTH